MQTGAKVALGCVAVAVLAIGGQLAYLHHERNKPVVINKPAEVKTDPDDLVFLKHKRPDKMDDLKELYGTTIWVSAGGQMDYYPVTGKSAQYAKPAGTLLGAQEMQVKSAIEQAAPKNVPQRIPVGDKQVLLTFTLPKSDNPTTEYAVPVGYRQAKDYTFFTDEIFFYDDPHELYKHWGPEIWKAVDDHKVIMGMNERQVELSLGQVSKPNSNDYGNRTVVFDNLGKPMAVTFEKNHVTAFRAD
jgi:hypothetical protein